MDQAALRTLPSVDVLLQAMAEHDATLPRPIAIEAARTVLTAARQRVRSGGEAPGRGLLAAEAVARAQGRLRPSLRPVINATGVILQTNLGRAPLSAAARAAAEAVARAYSNLEYDLETGTRGSRHEHVRDLIRQTTGAEDGIAVNNNAAALYMALTVFAQGREVIISRGQAVEIGGGFRIPDVLRQSGARLVEVGTTNRTYTRDYADAIGPDTAAILRVHPSNFRVVGFTAAPPLAELAALARTRGVLLLDDLGSGCLVPTERFGLAHEPTVAESIAAGADLVFFSGDKLLGGPQAGIVAGRAQLVAGLRGHPLARALRLDKLAIAALTATLQSYASGTWEADIPVWRMASADLGSLRRRARRWARAAGPAGSVVAGRSMVGGGALPGEGLPTWCAAIRPTAPSPGQLARTLRTGTPAVAGRLEDDRLLLDPRTVDPADDRAVVAALQKALNASEEFASL
jgi:L-seryl-tRNA(Ser) seleniumtransferase